MLNNYKYSVVIPCYNAEKFIDRSMLSVINQTYKNLELIVVNDGSTDNSDSVVNEVISNNPNFQIQYIAIKNSGPATARNKGIEVASGDYICFLDSDDEYMPELFEKIDEVISNNDICFFEYIDCLEDGTIKGRYKDNYKKLLDNTGIEMAKAKIQGKMWICNCNAVYRKNMIIENKTYYPDGIFSGEDACFIYSNLLCAKKVTSIEYEGFKCYIRNDSLMHAPINDRFMTIVDSIDEITKRVKSNKYLNEQDREYFLNKFNSQMYFLNITLGKKIAYSVNNYIDFLKQIKQYKVNSNIKYKEVKNYYRKKEKIQIFMYKLSKLAFFIMVKFYDKNMR